jgi:hypothetical protein
MLTAVLYLLLVVLAVMGLVDWSRATRTANQIAA